MKKISVIFLVIFVVLISAAILHFSGLLSVAGDPNERTMTLNGHEITYTANWANNTRESSRCFITVRDDSTPTALSISSQRTSDCESSMSTVTVKPLVDLSKYQTVTIRRSVSMNIYCQGRYSSITSSINGQSQEFAYRSGYDGVVQDETIGDIYISNDGNRIKVESNEGALFLDNRPGTYLTLTSAAGCTFQEGRSTMGYSISGIETKPFAIQPLPPPVIDVPERAFSLWERFVAWLRGLFA